MEIKVYLVSKNPIFSLNLKYRNSKNYGNTVKYPIKYYYNSAIIIVIRLILYIKKPKDNLYIFGPLLLNL
jgi:hypothetical protein